MFGVDPRHDEGKPLPEALSFMASVMQGASQGGAVGTRDDPEKLEWPDPRSRLVFLAIGVAGFARQIEECFTKILCCHAAAEQDLTSRHGGHIEALLKAIQGGALEGKAAADGLRDMAWEELKQFDDQESFRDSAQHEGADEADLSPIIVDRRAT